MAAARAKYTQQSFRLRWTREGGRRRSESRSRQGRPGGPQDCRSRSRPRGHSRPRYVGERSWTHLWHWSLPIWRKPAGDAHEWLLAAMHNDLKLFAQINKVGLHPRW